MLGRVASITILSRWWLKMGYSERMTEVELGVGEQVKTYERRKTEKKKSREWVL